jgi:GcrA cell cycle regulator
MLWTDTERTRLRELRPHHGLRYIAAELGRPYSAVAHEASRMKLGRPRGHAWSEQDSADIASLWPHCSASVIARRLGRSRNAVIGKVKRLRDDKKLQLRATPHPALSDRPKPQPKLTPVPPGYRNGEPSHRTSPNDMPMQCPCQLIDLDDINCRWPHGDPRLDGFYFCGARVVEGRDYCATHLRLAHHPDPADKPSRFRTPPVSLP